MCRKETKVLGAGEVTKLGNAIQIGKNVKFGKNVVLYNKVQIGNNVTIEHNSIIGYNHLTHLRREYVDKPLVTKIGDNVLIRPNSTIYAGCKLENNVTVNSNTVIREFTVIGERSFLGNGVVVEGYTQIGKHVAIHAQCHITAKAIIGDYVFFGPLVTTANERKISWQRNVEQFIQGPVIERGVRIGAGAIVLPGVRVGREALIGAGAVVTNDVPPFKVVMGIPAKVVKDIPKEERLSR